MSPADLEALLRRVVREELDRRLSPGAPVVRPGRGPAAPAEPAAPPSDEPTPPASPAARRPS